MTESNETQRFPPAGPFYSQSLERFEAKLGDPSDEGPLSGARAAQRDEREEYPYDAIELLGEVGAPSLHIPATLGGSLGSLEQVIAASYSVGRRDASVALASGLQMWAHLVWMAGSSAQQSEIQSVLAGNGAICLAASEAMHGADLLSIECRAETTPKGYSLRGEKWPIGCATQARAALVLARTDAQRGPRSLSWFLLDEEALEDKRCGRLPKVHTLGFRGADLSGLSFDDLALPAEAMLGDPGYGFELAAKVFQLTRPLVASLSLGPGETALRLATEFAMERQLYRRPLTDVPSVRTALVCAWVDFTIAEILLVGAVRAAHFCPRQLNVRSLVAKILAPNLIRRAIDSCGLVLGARSVMRDYASGAFQKASRDQAAVSIIEGSTEVCLQLLAAELPRLVRPRAAAPCERLRVQCTMQEPVPELNYGNLVLDARGKDDIVAGIARLVGDNTGAESNAATRILAEASLTEGDVLFSEISGAFVGGDAARHNAPNLAYRYAIVHSLAACAAFSECNRRLGAIIGRPVGDRPNGATHDRVYGATWSGLHKPDHGWLH